MNTTDTIIIGEGFYGLFVAIKIAEKGYNVKIFEKNAKPLFSNNIRFIFPDNYIFLKKFLHKLNISYTYIANNLTHTICNVVQNLDKMPTSLQQDTLFIDACNNILNKNTIALLKNELYEFVFLSNIDTYSALQLIKKNYINVQQYVKITESSLSILKKMREYFKSLNGQIYYNNNVYSVTINSINQFICNINNRNWYSNILISCVNVDNLLTIFNWNDKMIEYLTSLSNVKNKKVYNVILNKCHISIPIKISTSVRKFNLNHRNLPNILGNDIHFYVCNEDFSNTPYWINGTTDIVNDINKYI